MIDVSVTKSPLELVVTSTAPIKVMVELSASRDVKLVVYSVHLEHSEGEAPEITEVRVIKTPFEFVVTST